MAMWRAAFAALVLLFSSLSPSLSLVAATEQDVCAMECCVAEGHCCCAMRKPWVKGQKPDGRPVVERVEIRSQSCCFSTPPSSSNFIPREMARPAAHNFDLARHQVIAYHNPPRAHHSIWRTPTPPRAPPSLLVYS
jgi:hypothetical protein